MARLVFSKMFKLVSNKKFGIRPRHVEDAVEDADDTSQIVEEGIEVTIYRKHVEGGAPYELLVLESVTGRGERTVDLALKVTSDLVPNVQNLSPLQSLEKVVERYGVKIQIGDKKARFFLREKVPVHEKDPRRYIRIGDGKGGDHSPITYLRTESFGLKLQASCVLCFCLDNKRYGKWLKTV